MKNNIIFLLGLVTSAAMVACYPPPPPPQPLDQPEPQEEADPEVDPTDEGLNENAQDELDAVRDDAGIQTTNPDRPSDPDRTADAGAGGGTIKPIKPGGENNQVIPPANEDQGPKNYPFATPVPNRPGFVFNPFNQKKVDVRGLPSGTLVSDPRDPNQKFYVP